MRNKSSMKMNILYGHVIFSMVHSYIPTYIVQEGNLYIPTYTD